MLRAQQRTQELSWLSQAFLCCNYKLIVFRGLFLSSSQKWRGGRIKAVIAIISWNVFCLEKKNGIATEVAFAMKSIYFFKVFAIINTLMF